MDKEFQELNVEYLNAKRKHQQEEQAVLRKMKENLKKRNGGENKYSFEISKCEIFIENAEYDGLCEIDGDKNYKTSENKREEYSNKAREQSMKDNLYGPGKEYPQCRVTECKK